MPKTTLNERKNVLITEDQVAVICPTKDQPQKVERLLDSICNLKSAPNQIIVADGGHNLKPLTDRFSKSLNITCLYCPEPGQVLQRNYAQKFLLDEIRLVLHIDDDNTFEPDALFELLNFWNHESNSKHDKQLAGVSFNVVDLPTKHNSYFRRLFFLGTKPEGTVSMSGYARPFLPTDKNRKTSWLLGGSTAWSRDVLTHNPHPIDFQTKWAVCEDLIYSYPLSKSYRLLVAKNAIAYHNETYEAMAFNKAIFYGNSSVILRHFFIAHHQNFNIFAFIWMTIGIAMGHVCFAILGNKRHAGLLVGTITGLSKVIVSILLKKSKRQEAENLFKLT